MTQRGITDTGTLQFAVPSLQVGTLVGNTILTIRGIGMNAGGGTPGVAIHVDGVYLSQPNMGNLLQTDLERVEVLRGPQGTIYGRNANGGVVNFITKKPTDEFEGYVQAGIATYAEASLQGMLNLPLSDTVAMRAVVDWNRRYHGFVKNIISGGQDVDKGGTISGRLSFAAELAPNLRLDLSGTFLRGTGPTQYFTLHEYPAAFAIAANPALATATYTFEPWKTSANDPINTNREFYLGIGTLAWDIGPVTLKSITGYAHMLDDSMADDDGINISLFPVPYRYNKDSTFSQEINAAVQTDMADLVTGLYYLNSKSVNNLTYDMQLGVAPAFPGGLPPESRLIFENPAYRTNVKAVFGDLTLKPVAGLKIYGGIRYSEEKQSQRQHNQVVFGAGGPVVDTCALRVNHAKFKSTTPRVGASYEFSSDVNAYATYSKGYKAGGFNLFQCNNQYEPETINSYEAGLKTQLLDRSLMLNLTGFYYDYKDMQVSQVVGLTRVTLNAAAARIKGLEAELSWRPDSHWIIDGNLSLIDAKYKQFSNVDGINPGAGVQNLDGKRLNAVPKLATNFGIGYRTTPSDIGTVLLRADLSQRSRQYFREFNLPLDAQSAYALLSASIMWESPDERYRVRIYGTNLTNKGYVAQMDSSDNFGARFVTWGAPRQIGIELRAGF